MTTTLEKYQRCNLNPIANSIGTETQIWCQEVSLLNAKYESLQHTQRHLLGEDLGPLSLKELQSLEKQLEGALGQTRHRKVMVGDGGVNDIERNKLPQLVYVSHEKRPGYDLHQMALDYMIQSAHNDQDDKAIPHHQEKC